MKTRKKLFTMIGIITLCITFTFSALASPVHGPWREHTVEGRRYEARTSTTTTSGGAAYGYGTLVTRFRSLGQTERQVSHSFV